MKRRDFLELAGAVAVSAALPPAELLVHTGRPQNLATPLEWLDREITPTQVFFVRSHFGPPALRPGRKLRLDGLVARPIDLTVSDLARLPEVTLTAVLQCAGNGRALHEPHVPGVQWVHGAMGQATWTGVRLRDLLTRAGMQAAARHVRLEGADSPPKPQVPRFVRSLPLERALDPTTLVAYRMNGEPLTLAHGAPLRLVVPGWAGDHWVKWLTSMRVQSEEAEGFYYRTGYRLPKQPVAPGTAVKPEDTAPLERFPVKSIIARPSDGARVPAGPLEVAGVAFSGAAPIARVEVSTDGGAHFAPARLEGTPGIGRWQVYRYPFDAAAGSHEIVARATDASGQTQPERAVWNPSGYFWNGWHRVRVTVGR